MDDVKGNNYKENTEIELNHKNNSKVNEKEKEKGKDLNNNSKEKKENEFVKNSSFKNKIITKHISLKKSFHKSPSLNNEEVIIDNKKRKSYNFLYIKVPTLFQQNQLKQDKEVKPEQNQNNFSINQLENNIQTI